MYNIEPEPETKPFAIHLDLSVEMDVYAINHEEAIRLAKCRIRNMNWKRTDDFDITNVQSIDMSTVYIDEWEKMCDEVN